MSRLQVGGLALIIKGEAKNIGKTVELTSHLGSFKGLADSWFVFCEDGLILSDESISNEGAIESHRLLPLGDKQTQDELSKEKEFA